MGGGKTEFLKFYEERSFEWFILAEQFSRIRQQSIPATQNSHRGSEPPAAAERRNRVADEGEPEVHAR